MLFRSVNGIHSSKRVQTHAIRTHHRRESRIGTRVRHPIPLRRLAGLRHPPPTRNRRGSTRPAGLHETRGARPLDGLRNSAGTIGNPGQRTGKVDYANWAQVLDVTTMGPLRVTEAFLENVARSDRKLVVTITSGLGSLADNTSGG